MSNIFRRSQMVKHKIAALDALRTNVMLADAKLNITYLNPELDRLLRQAEPELKQELSRFNVDTLVGSNIDIFHKNPSHQRNMLATLQRPHNASIKVGSRVFDLLVTPLREGTTTVGFVVEWADARERLLNLDYSGQMQAVGRSQAVIEFATDGTIITANENFLTTMGYQLSEVAGRNHSMFVEASYRDSAEYREFWEALRNGKYQAAEFRRLGKAGREVFIQGSYNPIFDANGKVTKVVKYATDVTARVRAVAEVGAALSDLADGKLGRRIEKPLTPELDQLRVDYNQALEGLEAAMGQVKGATSTIGEGMSEIATAANDLSQRTEQQAASLEETVAALSEITRGINGTAADAVKANQATATALRDAENGGTVVSKAVDAMSKIEASSQQISQIIGVIDEIAFQTNLLALNAGVEAARAGEAGKGFAVVAQEVRALAQRSAEAAKEIKGLITTSSEQVERGVELVTASGKSLQEIVAEVASMAEIISAIASSAKEQATSLKEVSTAADQMDKVTQQNAAMVEQATAACQALGSDTERLAGIVAKFQMREVATGGRTSAARAPAQKPRAVPQLRTGSQAQTAPRPANDAKDWEEF